MLKNLILIKLQASLSSFLFGKSKSSKGQSLSPGKLALTLLVIAILAASAMMLVFSTALSMAMVFVSLGYDELYFGIFTAVSLAVVFFFSVFETKTELFECRDNALLLSLPIKSGYIVISRVFVVLLYNYFIEALIAVPVIVSYLMVGGSYAAVAGSVVVFLTLPLLATALSGGIGYLIAAFAKRFKYKTLATVIISLVFLTLYFMGYSMMMEGANSFADDLASNAAGLNESLTFIVLIGAVSFLSPVPTLVYLLVSIGVSVAAYLIISRKYIEIITDESGAAKKAYRAKRQEKRSVMHALVKKEFGRFLSSANYILNASMGVLFTVLLTGALIFGSSDIDAAIAAVGAELGISGLENIISPLLVAVYSFVAATNMHSASALSLEGKSYWIIKSLPISAKELILAKTAPHILVCAPVSSVCAFVAAIVVKAPLYYYPLYILTPVAAILLFANVGIILNVLFPKFDYINEVQVVKQSLPVFIAIFAPMILMLAATAFVLALSLMGLGLLASVLTFAVLLVLVLVSYVIMLGPVARRLSRL